MQQRDHGSAGASRLYCWTCSGRCETWSAPRFHISCAHTHTHYRLTSCDEVEEHGNEQGRTDQRWANEVVEATCKLVLDQVHPPEVIAQPPRQSQDCDPSVHDAKIPHRLRLQGPVLSWMLWRSRVLWQVWVVVGEEASGIEESQGKGANEEGDVEP